MIKSVVRYLEGSTVGGIAGYSSGNISNCNNIASTSGVHGGGIAGNNAGTITDCKNSGTVSGS